MDRKRVEGTKHSEKSDCGVLKDIKAGNLFLKLGNVVIQEEKMWSKNGFVGEVGKMAHFCDFVV